MKKHFGMRPHDVAILLKIIALGDSAWLGKNLADALKISQSEVSESLQRSRFAGLLDEKRRQVQRQAFLDFLVHGLRYVFPAQPGAIVRGVPTAQSALPLSALISSKEPMVWPHGEGKIRGQSIEPLYPNAVEAALLDPSLHELLALTDALRIGRAREREAATLLLEKKFFNYEQR